ncbi:MAG: BtpA/SgcQ family protein [Planctomycetaceae bacterium]|nr:BtpA/SgcQ family protein [Planctomycetaceae bacterium]
MTSLPLLPEWRDVPHPVIGMVHAPPLPGSPRYAGNWDAIESQIVADVEALSAGGVDGLMLENFGDTPFYPDQVPPITIACLTRLACAITRRTPLPLGINVLRNDARAALAVAVASGAMFVRVNVLCGARVTDQGVIAGQAHALLRERAALGAKEIRIFADVDVKHSAPLAARSLTDETHDLVLRGGADAVIVSGPATGRPVNVAELTEVQAAACNRPVLIGSGATADTVAALLPHCQGLIVGTSLKRHGDPNQPVDAQRVSELMAAVRG